MPPPILPFMNSRWKWSRFKCNIQHNAHVRCPWRVGSQTRTAASGLWHESQPWGACSVSPQLCSKLLYLLLHCVYNMPEISCTIQVCFDITLGASACNLSTQFWHYALWYDHSLRSHTLLICVASFPGRSHLQYLIACSMQIQRVKPWEIWSWAVMSDRQTVDTLGGFPFLNYQPRDRVLARQSQYHLPLMTSVTLRHKIKMGIIVVWQCPQCVYRTACDQISQAFPLSICILQTITYWSGNGLRTRLIV